MQFDYLWKLKVLKCLSKRNGVRVWSETEGMEFWVSSEIGKGKSHNFILVRFEIGLGFPEVGCTTPPKFPGNNPDMSGNPQAI